MGNVIRLSNGGTIQVRTGVLAGVGPAGPRGQIGPIGVDGAQGPVGQVGPMGQIKQVQTRANVSASTTVTPDTNTVVAFGSVAYDDMSAATSSVNFTIKETGDYLLNTWVGFSAPGNTGDGSRQVYLEGSITGVIARASYRAVEDDLTYAQLSFPYRCTTVNEIIQVKVRSGDDLAVAVVSGAFAITRVGSGPIGFTGPAGPQGPVGATGAIGPAGPNGSANGGYSTYAALLA